jgi:hypothetical protein
MSGFKNRERAEEGRFAHDQELEFKANARRAKLVGQWAASLMGLTGDEADAYAKSVVMADFEEAGDEDVYRKLSSDLAARGVTSASEALIRAKMVELLEVARDQVRSERG